MPKIKWSAAGSSFLCTLCSSCTKKVGSGISRWELSLLGGVYGAACVFRSSPLRRWESAAGCGLSSGFQHPDPRSRQTRALTSPTRKPVYRLSSTAWSLYAPGPAVLQPERSVSVRKRGRPRTGPFASLRRSKGEMGREGMRFFSQAIRRAARNRLVIPWAVR